MVNFLIQKSRDNYAFKENSTYKLLNHFNYKHFVYYNKKIRIDFLDYQNSIEKRFYSDSNLVIFYIGFVFFKNDLFDTLSQIKKLYTDGKDITTEIDSGKFIICIYDIKKDRLILYNDRFGLIPYFVYDSETLLICSEPKGIISSELIETKFTLDLAAVANYFNYGLMLSNKYLLSEIRKQSGAKIIFYENNVLTEKKYWESEFMFDKPMTDELINAWVNSFLEGLKKQRQKYPGNYICDISGGFDSRTIYFADNHIDDVFLIGEDDCREYSHAINTLKMKPSKLHRLISLANKEKYLKLFEISDLVGNLNFIHDIDIINFYLKNKQFNYSYNGFFGDFTIGGMAGNRKKEALANFGIRLPYDYSDLKSKSKGLRFLNDRFASLLDKYDDFDKYYGNCVFADSEKIRRKRYEYKALESDLNMLNCSGPYITNKILPRIFPYCYYPLFSIYSEIRLSDTAIKKVHFKLLRKIIANDKIYNNLTDSRFKIKFKYPYLLKLLCYGISEFSDHHKIYKQKGMYNHAVNLSRDIEFINFAKDKFSNTKYKILIKEKLLIEILSNTELLFQNLNYVINVLSFILFLEKYENKIVFDILKIN